MAIDFSNDYFRVGAINPALDDLQACTFAAWMNADSYPTSGGLIAICDVGWAYRKMLTIFVAGPNNYLMMWIGYTAGQAYRAPAAPATGQWHHVCGRWQDVPGDPAASVPDVFINGVNPGGIFTPPAGAPSNDLGRVMVGAATGVPNQYFDGKLADTAIWDRRLTDQEILNLATGTLRAPALDPTWHVTLEAGVAIGGLANIRHRDTTGRGFHIDGVIGNPTIFRDPPLHWPDEPQIIPFSPRPPGGAPQAVYRGTRFRGMRRSA